MDRDSRSARTERLQELGKQHGATIKVIDPKEENGKLQKLVRRWFLIGSFVGATVFYGLRKADDIKYDILVFVAGVVASIICYGVMDKQAKKLYRW